MAAIDAAVTDRFAKIGDKFQLVQANREVLPVWTMIVDQVTNLLLLIQK